MRKAARDKRPIALATETIRALDPARLVVVTGGLGGVGAHTGGCGPVGPGG